MKKIRICMAQINPTVGAIGDNAKKIKLFITKAKASGCDLVVFPELALVGYPPEDLLLKASFVDENIEALKKIASEVHGIVVVIGFVGITKSKKILQSKKSQIYNSAAVIEGGLVRGLYHKMHLPNYGVFDEERYFSKGSTPLNFKLLGVTFGLGICEDIWEADGPAKAEVLAGAEVILNINASPYHHGKVQLREEMLAKVAKKNKVSIIYSNCVGGQDELVFDGESMVVDEKGEVVLKGASFAEELIVFDLEVAKKEKKKNITKKIRVKTINLKSAALREEKKLVKRSPSSELTKEDKIIAALVIGTKDYARKNGFKDCVIGLSGGLDSALVSVVAVKALGKKNVLGIFMPTRYSSEESQQDAELLAKNLGIEFLEVSVEELFKDYLKMTKNIFKKKKASTVHGITEENIQARIRGNIIMALSNKFGSLVLTTGNKSEMSVGYATLYGDMAGGFAVIKDVPKTLALLLCKRINEVSTEVIPKRILTKPPTAELRLNQRDEDTLPPYEVLDPILKAYVEENKSCVEIVEMGFKSSVVKKIISLVDKSEYKRRQAPPGIKITQRAFGRDRRMPITNRYK